MGWCGRRIDNRRALCTSARFTDCGQSSLATKFESSPVCEKQAGCVKPGPCISLMSQDKRSWKCWDVEIGHFNSLLYRTIISSLYLFRKPHQKRFNTAHHLGSTAYCNPSKESKRWTITNKSCPALNFSNKTILFNRSHVHIEIADRREGQAVRIPRSKREQ